MREIMFRGKVDSSEIEALEECGIPHTNGWIYGAYVHDDYCPYIISHNVVESFGEYFCPEWWWPVLPESVGQFTGMRDKNGKEIFEGDILLYSNNVLKDVVRPVVYKWGGFGIEGVLPGTHIYFGNLPDEDIKVIGNIHDNPELLPRNPIKNRRRS